MTALPERWCASGPVDVCAVSANACRILDDDEFDFRWFLCQVPLVELGPFPSSLDDAVRVLDRENPESERARFAAISAWVDRCGSVQLALAKSPPLALADGGVLQLLDGWHRLVVAHLDSISMVPLLVGCSV